MYYFWPDFLTRGDFWACCTEMSNLIVHKISLIFNFIWKVHKTELVAEDLFKTLNPLSRSIEL